MDTPTNPGNTTRSQGLPAQKLMAKKLICTQVDPVPSVEVQRGMVIRSREGVEVGKVAAVVLDSEGAHAAHILLCRLPERSGYWLVPLVWVAQVRDGIMWLSLPQEAIEMLPRWHAT